MRVTRSQIVHGIAEYIQTDILPQLGNGRGLQILVAVGANTVAGNNKLVDVVFGNPIVGAILDDDGSGTYEINGLVDAMKKSIEQFGSFPVQVPAIPLISPAELTLNLSADDVAAMRSRIETAV